MKTLRSNGVRLAAATVLAATMSLLTVDGASADPTDPVCIMPPEDFCSMYGAMLFGTGPGAHGRCLQYAIAQQEGEYCNTIDWRPVATKPD